MNTDKKHNFSVLLLKIVGVLGILFIGVIIYCFIRPVPIEYYDLPYKLDKYIFKPGDEVRFDVKYCAKKDVPYLVIQRLVGVDNENAYYYHSPEVVVQKGCKTVRSTPKQIPNTIVSGRYKFEFVLRIDEFFKIHKLIQETEVFEVIR